MLGLLGLWQQEGQECLWISRCVDVLVHETRRGLRVGRVDLSCHRGRDEGRAVFVEEGVARAQEAAGLAEGRARRA